MYLLRVSCQLSRWRRWSFSLLGLCVGCCREDDRDACPHLSRLCNASIASCAVNAATCGGSLDVRVLIRSNRTVITFALVID